MSALRDFFLRPPEHGAHDRGSSHGDAAHAPDGAVPTPRPPGGAPASPAAAPASPVAVPVATISPSLAAALCAPSDLWPAAGLVAGHLRARARASAAVVCAWTPGGFDDDHLAAGPAFPAARRAAQRLADRGLQTVACGALCRVLLPADPDAAVRAARSAIAVANAPVVVALGLNAPAFAGLLSVVEETVVLPAADADAALYELAPAGKSVRVVAVPAGSLTRLRSRLGLARLALGSPAPAVSAAPQTERGFAPPSAPILDRR